MPRLPPRLLRQARLIEPLLPLLLRATHHVPSARNELRWLREHALALHPDPPRGPLTTSVPPRRQHRTADPLVDDDGDASSIHRHTRRGRCLVALCAARARGVPLQYLLGSEFFGALSLRCRRGVLIPRWETASLTAFLARLLARSARRGTASGDGAGAAGASGGASRAGGEEGLRVLDLCTGSGAIALLLHHELQAAGFTRAVPVRTTGVDVSGAALGLARENLALNHSEVLARSPGSSIEFVRGDVLAAGVADTAFRGEWDVVVANPPYVSPRELFRSTARSVRQFEPRLALVPEVAAAAAAAGRGGDARWSASGDADARQADTFYGPIFDTALRSNASAVLVEIGDEAQAQRVLGIARGSLHGEWRGESGGGMGLEVWRDEPTLAGDVGHAENVLAGVKVRGRGAVRAVFAWRRGRAVVDSALLDE